MQRVEIEEASAGDLVAVAGFDDVNIGETIACPDEPTALPLIKVDEPTLQMTFVVNDSPFAGKEGKFVTSRQVRDRLQRELLTNGASGGRHGFARSFRVAVVENSILEF